MQEGKVFQSKLGRDDIKAKRSKASVGADIKFSC